MSKPNNEKVILLSALYDLSRNNKISELNQLSLEISLNEAKVIIDEVTYKDWEEITHRIDVKRKIVKSIFSIIPVLIMIFLLVFTANWLISKKMFSAFFVKYTPTAFVTSTTDFIPTEKPTQTPTQTLTPIPPTLTPTPILPSAFLINDSSTIYPSLPVGAINVWLLENNDALTDPPKEDTKTWKIQSSKDANSQNREIYITKNKVEITWNMDQPFNEKGIYGIYLLDKMENSKNDLLIKVYNQDDQEKTPIQPYSGMGEITCVPQKKSDLWDLVGFYEFSIGQKISVQISVDSNTQDQTFALDRLLIVKVNEQTSKIINELPIRRKLVAILDNISYYYNELSWVHSTPDPSSNKDDQSWSEVNLQDAWLGKAWLLGSPKKKISIRWEPGVEVKAGNYIFYIWIPNYKEHNAIVTYELTLDDKPLPKGSNISESQNLNQALYQGKWVWMEEFPIDKDGLLSVVLKYVPDSSNQSVDIIVDAIAIVRIDE